MKQTQSDIDYINKIFDNSNRIIANDILWCNVYTHTIIIIMSISDLDPKYVDVIVERYCKFTGNYKIQKNGEEIEWKMK